LTELELLSKKEIIDSLEHENSII